MPTVVKDDAVKAAETRLAEIERGIEEGQQRYRELRQKRGALVAAGKDAGSVKRDLEAANAELEALEDALPHARRAVERAHDAARAAVADEVRAEYKAHRERRLELAAVAEEQLTELAATLGELRAEARAMFEADKRLKNLGASAVTHADRLQSGQNLVNRVYGALEPVLPRFSVANAGTVTRPLPELERELIQEAGG